jgi:predicted Zn-dependent peptidase
VTTNSRLESTVLETRLPNGLQVLGQQIPGVESAAAMFWVKTGARDEDDKLAGVSHFLEHMAFKRTATRTYEEINRQFEEMGAENNAFTSLEMTAFHARVLGDRIHDAIDLLADLTRPVLDKDDFDQERNVILEEIARHNDQPYSLMFDEFFKTFFSGQPLGHSTLGTPETISAMTVDQMREYWRRRYVPDNIIFSIAGNFQWDAVVEQLRKLTSEWPTNEAPRIPIAAAPAPSTRILTNERWNQEHLVVGVPSIKQGDPEYYTASVLANILGDDTGSRLFWSVNQTGLADQVGAGAITFSDAGMLFVIAVTEPEKARETLEVIRRELDTLQSAPVTADELERAKMKLLTSVVIEGESTRARMNGLIESWLSHQRLETLEEIRSGIEAVTVDSLTAFLRAHPLNEVQVLTALGPLEEADLV